MTKQNRSLMLFGLSTAMLAAGLVTAGMNRHPDPLPAKTESSGFPTEVLEAKDILRSNLERRFSDTSTRDFGMSRVATARSSGRLHVGPLMGLRLRCTMAGTRPAGNGQMEVYVDGKWIPAGEWRPIMKTENRDEARAVETFKNGQVDVAIYTFGRFDLDREGTYITTSQPRPVLGSGLAQRESKESGIRARGPAYVDVSTANAPIAGELAGFVRRAWASDQVDYTGEGKGRWVYFARRMSATRQECIGCHVNQGPVKEVGDKLGLFVIALRQNPAK